MPFTPRRLGSVAYSLVMFIIVSVLAGVLIAGLFVPFAGLAGVSSKAAAAELDNLPAELATPAPPTRSKVLMGNGKILAYFYDENRIPVKLDKIAPVMRQAQIAIEDHRFYEHGALDFKGTLRALVRNSAPSGNTQGGSSITPAVREDGADRGLPRTRSDIADCVKDAQAPTMERKIRELRYAIAMEKKFSKDQILERYLNIAYYGEGAYGVEAAARHYYSTTAAKLTWPQAAMLAGLVQNPDTQQPGAQPQRGARPSRRGDQPDGRVEVDHAGAGQDGQGGQVQPEEGQAHPQRLRRHEVPVPVRLRVPDAAEDAEPRQDRRGAGEHGQAGWADDPDRDRPEDPGPGSAAVSGVVGPKDPLISTMNMIQPGTGLIIAMAQSRPVMGSNTKKGETYWNLAVEPAMGGLQGYQAGSTFKAFTAAAALEKGIPLTKKYNARSPMNFGGRRFETCEGRSRSTAGTWCENSTGTNGRRWTCTGGRPISVNTYFIQLELAAGMCRVTKMAKKLGVKVGTPEPRPRRLLPGQAVLHPRLRRGQPAVDGRGVRDLRRPRHPLQPDHHLQDHHPGRQGPRGARTPTASG